MKILTGIFDVDFLLLLLIVRKDDNGSW